MLRFSTAGKLAIARTLRGVVGGWCKLRGNDVRQVRCTRNGVEWLLNLDEGVQLALYLRVYERSTTRALARLAKAEAVVIDIGANIGAQALPLANRVGAKGRVIAIEPADTAMARLRDNCALNPALSARMTLIHRALVAPGEQATETYFASWPLTLAKGAHPVHQGAPERSSAIGSTLDGLVDELGLTRVDLIKLDVDGNELPVLRGAAATLARHRPIVVFELCPYLLQERGEAPTALTRLFIEHGYTWYDERTLKPLPLGDEQLVGGIPAGGSVNVVAAARPLPSPTS
jgi:FkbM family methyltransferase